MLSIVSEVQFERESEFKFNPIIYFQRASIFLNILYNVNLWTLWIVNVECLRKYTVK